MNSAYTRGRNGKVSIRDAETGEPVLPFLPHPQGVHLASFSPDGRHVGTAGPDGAVRLWDAATGRQIHRTLSHTLFVYTLAFSPDGKRLVTGSDDQTARVWDVDTGVEAALLRHRVAVVDVSFSSKGDRFATASHGREAYVWDTRSDIPLIGPLVHSGIIYSVRFSLDGRWLFTASLDGTARVWDSADGAPISPPLRHMAPVREGEFSPDGKLIATAGQDHVARLWDFVLEPRPVEDLERLAGLLAGYRIRGTTGVAPLKGEEMARLFAELGARDPDLVSVPAEKATAWHRAQAEALFREERFEETIPHFDKVLEGDPGRPTPLADRARAFAELGHWDRAQADLERAVALRPDAADLWRDLALSHLGGGDTRGYLRACETMLERFGETRNPDRAFCVARTCLLLPSPENVGRLLQLSETAEAVRIHGGSPTRLGTMGAARFRAGEIEAAAETLRQAIQSAGTQG